MVARIRGMEFMRWEGSFVCDSEGMASSNANGVQTYLRNEDKLMRLRIHTSRWRYSSCGTSTWATSQSRCPTGTGKTRDAAAGSAAPGRRWANRPPKGIGRLVHSPRQSCKDEEIEKSISVIRLQVDEEIKERS